jgi:hypothetical protein
LLCHVDGYGAAIDARDMHVLENPVSPVDCLLSSGVFIVSYLFKGALNIGLVDFGHLHAANQPEQM